MGSEPYPGIQHQLFMDVKSKILNRKIQSNMCYCGKNKYISLYGGVLKIGGTPRSSILMVLSIINHLAMGVPLFMETPMEGHFSGPSAF